MKTLMQISSHTQAARHTAGSPELLQVIRHCLVILGHFRARNQKAYFVILLIGVLLVSSGNAFGQVTKTWVPTNGGSWTSNGNWSPSGVPGAGDHVLIPNDQTGTITNIGNVTLNGLTINGNCNLISSAGQASFTTLTITQSFSVAANKTVTVGTNNIGRLNLTLATTSTGTIAGTVFMNSYSSSGYDRTFTNSGDLSIASAGLITGQNTSIFTLSSDATLRIANTAGITATGGGATGAVLNATRNFNTGAHYVYNGTAAQNTGTGYPTALTGSLTIDNSAGVTIVSATRTITTGTLNLVSGNFNTAGGGTNRLTIGQNVTNPAATINRSGGTLSGTLQGTTSYYNVIYTGVSKSTGNELSGAFRNLTVNLDAGQTLSLNQIRTLNAGNLTISSGTFNLSTFTINRSAAGGTLSVANGATLSIAGTNTFPTNYNTHSVGATSTIEYAGANQSVAALNSAQTYGNLALSGSGTKTFGGVRNMTNNLSIATGVVANLGTFTHSANTLTLAGNGTGTGSFGGTGSSADNINTTFFASATGIVNVSAGTCSSFPTATITKADLTCFGAGNGEIIIASTGGIGTLLFSINEGNNWQSGNSFTGLPAGNYPVRVKDSNGCIQTNCTIL